jgi:ATP diphosphatase
MEIHDLDPVYDAAATTPVGGIRESLSSRASQFCAAGTWARRAKAARLASFVIISNDDCLLCARSFTFIGYLYWRMPTTGERFERAVAIMERLRAPGGCPWDREQTFDSIKPYTLEETFEVLEAIDNRDWPELTGELGDLLLQVLFYAEMANEQGSFSIDDVLDRLSSKLIHRHPHVFGDVKADTSAEVKRNWEALKIEERKRRQPESDREARRSVLAGVSSAMPALLEASKLSSRAAQAGFDWPNVEGLFEKLQEEVVELREHLKEYPAPGPRPQGRGVAGSGRTVVPEPLQAKLEEEVGDLFFVLVNVARYLSVDAESALRKTNRKFRRRFEWMEERLHANGRSADQASMDELESLWQQAKAEERRSENPRREESA